MRQTACDGFHTNTGNSAFPVSSKQSEAVGGPQRTPFATSADNAHSRWYASFALRLSDFTRPSTAPDTCEVRQMKMPQSGKFREVVSTGRGDCQVFDCQRALPARTTAAGQINPRCARCNVDVKSDSESRNPSSRKVESAAGTNWLRRIVHESLAPQVMSS